MLIEYAFRDEIANVYALTHGFPDGEKQFIVCKRRILPFRPYLLDIKDTDAMYQLSQHGENYVRHAQRRPYERKYIVYFNSYLRIEPTKPLMEMLTSEGYFNVWDPGAPLAYYEGENECYLALLRTYEIDDVVPESILSRRGCLNDNYRLDSAINTNAVRPVIPDDIFYANKMKLIERINEVNSINNPDAAPVVEISEEDEIIHLPNEAGEDENRADVIPEEQDLLPDPDKMILIRTSKIIDIIRRHASLAPNNCIRIMDALIEEAASVVELPTIESVRDRGSDKIRNIFDEIRAIVNGQHLNIEERSPKKTMLPFFCRGKGMLWISPQGRRMKLFLRPGKYEDKYHRIKPNGWGGYTEYGFHEDEYNDEMLKYIKELVKQAYNNG